MSNITKVEVQQSILALNGRGWPDRRIARELGVHRNTVRRYVLASKCTNPQTGKQGPPSLCEPYRERICEAYLEGLSIERIHQDLSQISGLTGAKGRRNQLTSSALRAWRAR